MNRRGFLRNVLAGAAVGVVATPALAELLTPKRSIFLPPRGGWSSWVLTEALVWEDPNAGIPSFMQNYIDPKIFAMFVRYPEGETDGHFRNRMLSTLRAT